MYRVFTEISGGVTGHRSAYMKHNDEEVRFETRELAETYIAECKASRSRYATFNQRYEIHEEEELWNVTQHSSAPSKM